MTRLTPWLLLLTACGGSKDPTDTDTADADADTDTDADSDADADADTDADTDTSPTAAGTWFEGEYDGVPFEMGEDGIIQFFCNNAGLGLYQLRVRTDDESLQVWLDLVNPVEGTTYEHPDLQGQNLALGSPYDIWPPSTNNRGILDHATIAVTTFDPEVRWAGTVDVEWVEDTANGLPPAWVTGSFDITCE